MRGRSPCGLLVEDLILPEGAAGGAPGEHGDQACTPSHDQTIRMRKLLSDGKLTAEAITAVMQEEKPNQKERIVLRDDRTRKLLPKDLPAAERETYIIRALEFYAKHRARQKERDRER